MKWVAVVVLVGSVTLLGIGLSTGRSPNDMTRALALRHAEQLGRAWFGNPRLGTNGLSCQSCHQDGGRFSAMESGRRIPALVGVQHEFPRVTGRQVKTLEDTINLCIVRHLGGRPLPVGSQRLALIDLYLCHLHRFPAR